MSRLALLFCLLTTTGCLSYRIHAPRTSSLRYEGAPAPYQVQLADARSADDEFSTGKLTIRLKFDGEQSELAYLQHSVAAELAARGIVEPAGQAAERARLQGQVRQFGVRNRRVSAFSPMVTFTRLSVDFPEQGRTVRIAAYSKQTKTPRWSMNELEDPCFNRPLHQVVGELAAKVNRRFIRAKASQAEVARLAARATQVQGDALLQVVNELGWSNHPDALEPLLVLIKNESEDVRGTALGALGTLGLPQSFETLRLVHTSGGTHTDRLMALKSIGDLGTDEALAYLRNVQQHPGEDQDETLEITSLYLDGLPAQSGAPEALQAKR
ncbi:MAG: hypothetical protein RLZZ450_7456 [Pseudomonadota bacterium]